MIRFNINLTVASAEDAISAAQKLREAGYDVMPIIPRIASGVSNHSKTEEEVLREKYRAKHGKGYRLTLDDRAKIESGVVTMIDILKSTVDNVSDTADDQNEESKHTGETY
jgi:hypothetical protein